jgi:hypothetical protein|tara:strand:+ start:1332 stop:1523 length:192 start_codon:yes stop_codon:yes gene_type:complete
MPRERRQAVIRTEKFLIDLRDPKVTPNVPPEIRKKAQACLKHFPTEFDMDLVAELAPNIFGDS